MKLRVARCFECLIDLAQDNFRINRFVCIDLDEGTHAQRTKGRLLAELRKQLGVGALTIQMTGVALARKKALDRDNGIA